MVNNKAFGMVQEALADAEVAELARPTLDDGESYHQLLADPSSFETYDIDAARTKGSGFARIQRYALERLIGAPDPHGQPAERRASSPQAVSELKGVQHFDHRSSCRHDRVRPSRRVRRPALAHRQPRRPAGPTR